MRRASLEHERTSDGNLTYIRVSGVVDESFQGERVASGVKSKNVVLNCAGITLVTSYGLRTWSDFLRGLERGKSAVHFVECSPTFVSEMNQVVEFTSNGHVLSCYAQYTCSCGANRQILLRTDLDADAIRSRKAPDLSCLVCGEQMEFDEEPGTYFPGLQPHTERELNSAVASFLEARLGYETDSHRQLKIQKDVSGGATVLVMSGTLDATLNGQKLAQGLQGDVVIDLSRIIHVQQQGLRSWREFLDEALQRADRLWLQGSPALVIERALDGISDQSGLQVVSARIPYHCHGCEGTEFALLDLAGKDGKSIRGGTFPERQCSNCKKKSKAMVGARVVEQLRALPEATLPRAIARASKAVGKKLEGARKAAGRSRRGRGLSNWAAAAAALSVVGAGLAVAAGATLLVRSKAGANTANAATVTTVNAQKFERPDWIVSDVQNSSYCVDLGWQLQCVGVSAYHANLDDAEADGLEGAIEAFVHTALLNVAAQPVAVQRQAYLKARAESIQAVEQAFYNKSKDTELQEAALGSMRTARSRVGGYLTAFPAPGAPSRRADWYWEEYKDKETGKSEFLAFVRVDASSAETAAFARHFSTAIDSGGAKFVPMVPAMGWLVDTEDRAGYIVSEVSSGGAVAKAGIEQNDLVLVSKDVATAQKPGEALLKEIDGGQLVVRRGSAYDAVKLR